MLLAVFGVAMVFTGVTGLLAAEETNAPPPIILLDPPDQGFFSKRLDYHGIPIKAHKDVADEALYAAYDHLALELGNIPVVCSNLVTAGAELHIVGSNQVTSDMPENHHFKGRPFERNVNIDRRTRGVGGLITSCGEENLLKSRNDRYYGSDICMHEFAHDIAQSRNSRRNCEQVPRPVTKARWRRDCGWVRMRGATRMNFSPS